MAKSKANYIGWILGNFYMVILFLSFKMNYFNKVIYDILLNDAFISHILLIVNLFQSLFFILLQIRGNMIKHEILEQ